MERYLLRGCMILLLSGVITGGCAPRGEEARTASEDSTAPKTDVKVSRAPSPHIVNIEELKSRIAGAQARAVVVNVWATWCIPCREEFPELVRLRRDFHDRGVELFFVSADFDVSEEDLVSFLTDQGVDFPSFLKTGGDMDFIDGLNPDWSGALPATFVYDGEGQLRDWWEGKVTYKQLEASLKGLLDGKEAMG